MQNPEQQSRPGVWLVSPPLGTHPELLPLLGAELVAPVLEAPEDEVAAPVEPMATVALVLDAASAVAGERQQAQEVAAMASQHETNRTGAVCPSGYRQVDAVPVVCADARLRPRCPTAHR